jgi:hypothetical protein
MRIPNNLITHPKIQKIAHNESNHASKKMANENQ